jgi:hypothetical protein
LLDGFLLLPVGLRMGEFSWSPVALWAAVAGSGIYHGINPGMGWPLAVSAGLMERSTRAFWAAIGWLALGHLLSMLAIILPFALLSTLLAWQRPLQIAAALVIIVVGLVLLLRPGHPRALVRIPPSRLVLWSFAVAMAHGAGLMLVPIYLGLCRTIDLDAGHRAASALIDTDLAMALLVSIVHAGALLAASGAMAWLVYRYLGLQFVARTWFNLDRVWAASLLVVGISALALTLFGPH